MANETAGGAADQAREQAQDIGEDLKRARDSAQGDLEELRRDLAKLSETVTSLVSSQAAYARETLSERARSVSDDIGHTIEQNPFTAVAIALGLGFLCGLTHRSR